MRSSINNLGSNSRAWLLTAAAVLLLALAAPAQAGERVKGKDILQVKDAAAQTLQCEDILVRVTDDTRIYNGDERRIAFRDIPEPGPAPILVEYSGVLSGEVVVAKRLVVRHEPQ